MPGLFKVEIEDIKRLNPTQLTDLMKCLISNELAQSGVPKSNAYVSLDINVPDGGVDGTVTLGSETPVHTEHIPAALTVFQSKSGTLKNADYVNELMVRGSEPKRLKERIREVHDANGAYMLFYGQTCLEATQRKRIAEMQAAAAIANPGKAPFAIRILDCTQIAEWTNQYLAAIILVARCTNRLNIENFTTWKDLSGYDFFQRPFVSDNHSDEHIARIRGTVVENRREIRLIGQSGLGKTRLVLEAFRPPADPKTEAWQQILSDGMVYIDCATFKDVPQRVHDFRVLGVSGTVVADNCDRATHEALVNEIVRHTDSKMTLVSVDFHVESEDLRAGEFKISRASIETLKKIIRNDHPGLDDHALHVVAQYADGYPQIAARFAGVPLEQAITLDPDLETTLTDRLIWGHSQPDNHDRDVIEALALFANIGFEGKVEGERHYIAEHLCEISRNDFYSRAMAFSPRILDEIGDFVRVSPLPLAIRLAERWYRRHDTAALTKLHSDPGMPPRLRTSLGDRFSDLSELEKAKDIARRLLDPNSPFGQAEVLNTDQGSRVFRSLAEVNPEVAVDTLIRAFGGMSIEEMRDKVGPGRRNLVWALLTLAFDRRTFERAMRVLARFAVAENETWGNNATAEFVSRFQLVLGGTEAEPALRLRIVDELINSGDEQCIALGIKALGRAITGGHGRVLGAEKQGRRVLKDWLPKTNADAHSYFEAATERLTKLALTDDNLGALARSALARGIRYVLRYRPQAIDKGLREILGAYRKAWPEALQAVEDALRFDLKDGPEPVASLAQSWVELLQPSDFPERVRLIVSMSPRGSLVETGNGMVNTSQEAARLFAEELGADLEAWRRTLPLVSSGEQRQGFAFGFAMGNLVPLNQQQEFAESAISELASAQEANPSVLMGLLGGFWNLRRENQPQILQAVVGNPRIARFAPKIMSVCRPTESDMRMLLPLLEDGIVKPEDFRDFGFTASLSEVRPQFVGTYFRHLLRFGLEGVQAALFITSMYTQGSEKNWAACRHLMRSIVKTRGLLEADGRHQLDHYSIEQAIKKLLNGPKRDNVLARYLATEITRICKKHRHNLQAYDVMQPTAFLLLEQYQSDAWPIFKKAIGKAKGLVRYHFLNLFERGLVMDQGPKSAILLLNNNAIEEWCLEQPTVAPQFIARNIPLFEFDGTSVKTNPLALMLVDKFGNDKRVLSELGGNLESFSFVGSLVPAYEQRLAFVSQFINDKSPLVSAWASEYATAYAARINSQKKRDMEEDSGIFLPRFIDEYLNDDVT